MVRISFAGILGPLAARRMSRRYAMERHCSRGARPASPGEEPRRQRAEDEPADVGEGTPRRPVRVGVE